MAFRSDQNRHLPIRTLERFRSRLAHSEALPQLTIMAIVCGFVTGSVAILFRLAIEWPLTLALPSGDSEFFEGLSAPWRLGLPIVGALILCLVYTKISKEKHRLGVSEVIDRYQLHQGRFSLSDLLLQFVAGTIALITGHTGGREGPAVHLGAASSSLIGQQLKLPNNSIRIMVGCGIAAAIAASFNTPLAGVIFAMEVVMMEYTVTGFIPIIISAATGSILCRLVFGTEPAFTIPPFNELGFWELPWLLVCGLVIGTTAAITLRANKWLLRFRHHSHWLRFMAAGLVTGLIAIAVPEVLGLGYDTVQKTLLGEIGLQWLAIILIAKLVAFTLTFAMGVPVGGIGPMFFLGACLGGIWGITAHSLAPEQTANAALYAILGMGGMMAATLNAPLAALVAVMELTNSPGIILPSMLVIVSSSLCARMLSQLPGLFLIGHDPRRYQSPVMQTLNRTGVTSVMERRVAVNSRHLPWPKAKTLLEEKPDWLVIADLGATRYLMRPAELARYLEVTDTLEWDENHDIDLLEIPAERQELKPLHPGATLQEAWIMMKKEQVSAVCITRPAPPLMSDVAGIITRSRIEAFYQV